MVFVFFGKAAKMGAAARLQMGKRLNTGNHFNSKQGCVVVALSQFFLRIPAAERAEIRILRHFIGILCVKHHRVTEHLEQQRFDLAFVDGKGFTGIRAVFA